MIRGVAPQHQSQCRGAAPDTPCLKLSDPRCRCGGLCGCRRCRHVGGDRARGPVASPFNGFVAKAVSRPIRSRWGNRSPASSRSGQRASPPRTVLVDPGVHFPSWRSNFDCAGSAPYRISHAQPVLPAIDSIAAHCDGKWSSASETKCAARCMDSEKLRALPQPRGIHSSKEVFQIGGGSEPERPDDLRGPGVRATRRVPVYPA